MTTCLRLALCLFVMLGGHVARAQMTLPQAAPPPDGPTLFTRQCGTCHTLSASEPARQGPPLHGVFGRKAGSVPGFAYSAGFAKTDIVWNADSLDRWLTNPQAVISGSVMGYRQSNAKTRRQIITYLQGNP